jgi:hypothetical protein
VLQSLPPLPFSLELLKVTIGPVIAAAFVIVGLLLKDLIERRNLAQSWFEQTYITQGLDMLVCHLSALKECTSETKRVIFITTSLLLYLSTFSGALLPSCLRDPSCSFT